MKRETLRTNHQTNKKPHVMNRIQDLTEKLRQTGILPLFYHADKGICIEVATALYTAGIRMIEFTACGEKALENFEALVQERNQQLPGLLLAVGTIRTPDQALQFLAAGADFLISPVFDKNIHAVAKERRVLWIPGCMTPTEIHAADQAGCKWIKLFPGNLLGPYYVESILPLFPGLEFIVTGGVDTSEQNVQQWFDAGVTAVGIGSKLISPQIIESGDFFLLQKETATLLQTLNKLRRRSLNR
jgi:2-dehydro-3-deoxyphosphogluconate aldolase/(4S)-4-hydroxy-2-oxoglutarate aldolase